MTWPPASVHDIPERLRRCVKTILQAASKMLALSSHLVKRLTRLSGLMPSGILVVTLSS